jgi:hypothetical protein
LIDFGRTMFFNDMQYANYSFGISVIIDGSIKTHDDNLQQYSKLLNCFKFEISFDMIMSVKFR